MPYIVTQNINVGGDFHKSGSVLRDTSMGTIESMLRCGQIVLAPEAAAAEPIAAKVVVEAPVTFEKPKKAGK